MKLIPNWKRWWRRHSVQIASLMPAITWAREHSPDIREHLPPDIYSILMVGLFVAVIVVMQIPQKCVSGEPK
jgi:hypothetical protein